MKFSKNDDELKWPDFKEKKDFHPSGITTMRMRPPTNPQTASKFTNMVFDHSKQMPMWPNRKKDALIEHTQGTKITDYDTINRSGKPYALGVMVGGSPDTFSNIFRKAPKAKIIKG